MMSDIFGKKFMLWAAIAALALLGVLLIFSIPVSPRASDNKYFGLVKDVYTPTVEEWTPVTLEGDTDIFPSAEVNLSLRVESIVSPMVYISDFDTRTYVRNASVAVSIRFCDLPERAFILTTQQYTHGKSVDNSGGKSCTVERLDEDGEWKILPNSYCSGNATVLGKSVIDREHDTLTHVLPVDASGTYRFTYCFRSIPGGSYDSRRAGNDFTTGKALYTVSCTVTVPEPKSIEPSDSKFDLLSFTLYHARYDMYASIVLYPNDGTPLHLSEWRARLEMYDDGRWVKLRADERGKRPVAVGLQNRAVSVIDADGGTTDGCIAVVATLQIPDPDGKYRLVLGLTEKAKGRGKEYPLTITFDLSKEN